MCFSCEATLADYGWVLPRIKLFSINTCTGIDNARDYKVGDYVLRLVSSDQPLARIRFFEGENILGNTIYEGFINRDSKYKEEFPSAFCIDAGIAPDKVLQRLTTQAMVRGLSPPDYRQDRTAFGHWLFEVLGLWLQTHPKIDYSVVITKQDKIHYGWLNPVTWEEWPRV